MTAAIEAYRFNEAAAAAYRFVWNLYLRLVPRTGEAASSTARTGRPRTRPARRSPGVLDEIVALLHPFMPFITEELWARRRRADELLALSPWPEPSFEDAAAAAEINWLIDLITAIRSVRSPDDLGMTGNGP